MFSERDSAWMAQAIRLAQQGLYGASPNPRVGCVLVNDEKLLGSGWHQQSGEPHAEIHALREAGDKARGATAYVTLEPCSHYGKTPPCADALIESGVARVVVAGQDPNPRVAGQGVEKLRSAGIDVEVGLMEGAARELNVGFLTRMTRGTPWVRSKIAMSLDGRTALKNGESKWITCDAARQDVQHWRARSCVVLTGIDTVLADDCQLNVRDFKTRRQPLRVVLDSQLRMPLNARILQGESVLIYTALDDAQKIGVLQDAGALICVLPGENEQVDLLAMLRDLAQRGFNEVLLEAGSTLNGAMIRAGLVDELLLYIAPQLLGDTARGMAQLGELICLEQRVDLDWQDVRQVGKDFRIQVKVLKEE